MKQQTILIVGASGTVGTELTRLLKAEGHKVIATTSREPKEGQVKMNVVTGEGIHQAFEGIDRAFLLSPPGYADQYKLLSPLIQEAKRRGLKKVVLMTAMGANANPEAPFRKAEIDLENSGLAYNIIRPNWFLENFNTFWIQGIKSAGKIFLPAGKAKTSFIDAADISAVAAKLLVSDELSNKDFDLTGSVAVDHDEVAVALTKASGRTISYQEIAPDEFLKGLVGAGVPADYAQFLGLIMGFLKEGYSSAVNDNVSKILGRQPRSLEQYAQQHRADFLA